MKFMMMHKMTEAMEQGTPPTPEQLEAIGALMGEAAAAGVFLSGEGLKPTRERLRVVYRGGARRITEGPLDDARDLLGGFALLSVRSCDDALAWLESNQLAEKEEFEHKQKEVEGICTPIMQSLYSQGGGGGMGGMPGGMVS